MSMTIAKRTELLGRIASDRQFRTLLLCNPRKAASELGIAFSEKEEGEILSSIRMIQKNAESTDKLLSDSARAPFIFSVLLTHDDGADEDEGPANEKRSDKRPH